MANELEITNELRKLGEQINKVGGHLKSIDFSYTRLLNEMAFLEEKKVSKLNELKALDAEKESVKAEAQVIIERANAEAKQIQQDIARRMAEVSRIEADSKQHNAELKKEVQRYEKLVKELQPEKVSA